MSKSQLSQPKLRFKGFGGEWKFKIIEEILDYIQPANFIEKGEIKNKGLIPILTPGKSFILGYTDNENDVFSENSSILIDDFNLSMHFVDFKYKVRSSACKILKLKDDNKNNLYLIYLIIKMVKFTLTEHKRYYISYFSKFGIWIPSLPEQQKIAQFFSLLDHHIKLWERKLELCLLKKKYYLDKNINNKINNKKFIRFSDLLQESTNKVNSTNCLVCSVGKTGFQERKINISLNNKVQELKSTTYGDLCIGMGTTQIDFKMNNIKDKMCGISKAYKVFKTNFNYPLFLELYVNRYLDYFSKNYMIVSARQGKNVDLESFLNDGIYFNSLDSVEKIVNTYKKIKKCEICIKLNIEKLKDRKKYYLNNLFI